MATETPPWAGAGAPKMGRYRLGPKLGHGGMGEVYEAWDTLLDRRVAVKSLTAPYAVAILRFMREAQLQARVSHPNVCRIYDVDAAGEVPFIAMQLVRGPTLWEAAPALSVDEAVEILAAVALAIQSAHRLGLIHRDLKPSNILLEAADGGGWNAFVADFGLAKDLAETGGLTQGTGGTPEYMAPEQKRGDAGNIGPATDIYALGATLRVVLALGRGALTVEPGTPVDQGWHSLVHPELPRKLAKILRRCLEPRPQDRYPSAGELAEDLRRFLDGEPLLTGRGEWSRSLLRSLRRHPTWAASLALTLLLGGAASTWSRHLALRGHRQAAMAQRFALRARDLESRMRVERLIPIHDIRPALARMREHLESTRADMARLGPEAQGPGNLALGRAYASMGEPELALGVLNQAWNQGYRTPELAYALCKATCDALNGRLDQLEMTGPDGLPPASGLISLEAARYYFNLSYGQSWEPQELGEARLLNLEGNHRRALLMARGAFHGNPWLFEAKIEEAVALTGLGQAEQRKGHLGGALKLYTEASLAAQEAQNIGHGDEDSYLADGPWRAFWLAQPGLGYQERCRHLDAMEHLADQALIIRPDGVAGIWAKTWVMLKRATTQASAGFDPEPELSRVERFLLSAAGTPGADRIIAFRRKQIQELRDLSPQA